VSESRVLRVDTHRVVMVLYGLCGSARAGLDFQPHPDAPGAVVAAFAGRNGGAGQVSIPDEPALRATLDWLAGHPKAEVYLRAVLAAVRACDGVKGGWALERVLELLWGPRKRRQSRWRKLPPVRRVVELLCEASWMLDAPVAAPPPATGKTRRRDKDRDAKRAGYGGTFCGCILKLDTEGRTVRLNDQLRRLLDAGPYDQRPAELFRLARPDHHNPRGTVPSRADCWLMVHGAWDYARFRQAEALRRNGAVQAVRVEDLLGRWTSVNLDSVTRRRLLPAFVDRLEMDLAAAGDVALAGPIERQRQAGRCELRLRISENRRPRSPTRPSVGSEHRAGPSRRRRDDRRPPAASTSSGTATSTGPPRP
jgi:hypothetical protein